MRISKQKYNTIVGTVIDKLEGGYYHPNMLKDGRVKDTRYANSGETMFGIDRKAGGAINRTAAGKQFWNLIDNANARNKWKWNYRGGSLEPSLKKLAGDIIYPEFIKNSKRYISPEAEKIIQSSDKLLFHFIYATWNGPGWFKTFATKINDAVSKGVRNTSQLVDIAVKSRTNSSNSLISQGGRKIKEFIGDFATFTKKNWVPVVSIIVVATAAIFIGYKISNKK